MRPPLEKFTDAMTKARGNVTLVAKAFKVQRHTVYDWMNDSPEYRQVLDDARGTFLDEVLTTARTMALGIPDLVKDEDGKTRQVGWIERPDTSLLRYLAGTLGRKEGFGEKVEVTTSIKSNQDEEFHVPTEAKEYFDRKEKELGRPLTKMESYRTMFDYLDENY